MRPVAVAVALLAGLAVLSAVWVATRSGGAQDAGAGTGATAGADSAGRAGSGEAAGAAATASRAEVKAPAPDDLEATSLAGPEVTGRVLFDNGEPAVHALIWTNLDSGRSPTTSSGQDGRYILTLPAGRHILCARHAGTGTARAPVDVPAGVESVAGPTLRLGEGGVIHGRVFQQDGRPAAGIWVTCRAEQGEVLEFFGSGGTHYRFGEDDVLTREDGCFRLKGLEPGVPHTVQVEIFPRKDVVVDPERRDGVLPDGAPVVFELRAIRLIAGVVLDAVTRQPIRQFKINEVLHDDERGRFETSLGWRGAVAFEAFGYLRQEREDLDLAAGETRRGLVIELERAPGTGGVRLVVTNDAGRPVPEFSMETEGGRGTGWRREFDEPDGTATLEGVPGGRHDWLVRARGHARELVEFTVNRDEETLVAVSLKRGAAVRLEIRDEAGSLFAGDVAIEDAAGAGPVWSFTYQRSQGATPVPPGQEAYASERGPSRMELLEGRGVIEGLPAGRYVLSVYFTEDPQRYPFEVFSTTAVDLVVQP